MLALVALGVPACRAAAQRPVASMTSACEVRRVIDGDTFACEASGRVVTVRLLGVDAPELRQQPFGATARRFLAAQLPPGSHVTLDLDVRETDRYGRVLAYVWTRDGAMANEALLRAGYAVVAIEPPNVKYDADLREAAAAARAARAGLWATTAFQCAPVDFRRGRCP